MSELKIQTWEDVIRAKLAKIINRTDIQITQYAKSMIKNFYHKMIKNGDFCIESLIEHAQSHDEVLLYEIAEETVRMNPDLRYYEKCKEKHGDDTYDDILDEIMNGYIMDYGIMLCLAYPPHSKSTIPYEFSYILDKISGSYYVMYPPIGSFQEYVGHIKLQIWYNDAQNSLCEECAVIDRDDDSVVTVVRPILEKIEYIE